MSCRQDHIICPAYLLLDVTDAAIREMIGSRCSHMPMWTPWVDTGDSWQSLFECAKDHDGFLIGHVVVVGHDMHPEDPNTCRT